MSGVPALRTSRGDDGVVHALAAVPLARRWRLMLITVRMPINLAEALRLLLVTDDALIAGRDIVTVCAAAVRGGCTAVQLRLKHVSDGELLSIARRLVAEVSVPVFVNDRLDVAMAAGAAGVHLGPDDVPPLLAKRIAPEGFIVGASVGTEREIERGIPADYWGIGPLRESPTKRDAGDALGMERAAVLAACSAGRPCVLIGGALPMDVAAARLAGFTGVAVGAGILSNADVRAAAKRYAIA